MSERTETEVALGFCWYDKTQWMQLKALDPENMEDTFEEWRKNAADALAQLQAVGRNIRKVNWCRERDEPPNSETRS